MEVIDYVQCPMCKWVHFLVDEGNGLNNCFMCSNRALNMVPAEESDCPRGSTIQGINRYAYDWRPPEEMNEKA